MDALLSMRVFVVGMRGGAPWAGRQAHLGGAIPPESVGALQLAHLGHGVGEVVGVGRAVGGINAFVGGGVSHRVGIAVGRQHALAGEVVREVPVRTRLRAQVHGGVPEVQLGTSCHALLRGDISECAPWAFLCAVSRCSVDVGAFWAGSQAAPGDIVPVVFSRAVLHAHPNPS